MADLATIGVKKMGQQMDLYASAKRYSEGKPTEEDTNLLMANAIMDQAFQVN